jgi:unsaturated chondroitin disaccharide hydrolase
MMDTLMNATLLLWAGKERGDAKYTEAGLNQSIVTNEYLIRKDGSSHHHCIFDEKTDQVIDKVTWQGHSHDSCWSRGHAWGIYGLPVAYDYTGADFLPKLHRDITYFMLNHLPSDCIPYWDYDFVSGDEPRDSSAGLISACGMMEMAKHLPESAVEKNVFLSAAAQILEATIDTCTGDIGVEYDGLINRVTHAKPQGQGIDECAVYADYFYLEMLARALEPEKFIRHW